MLASFPGSPRARPYCEWQKAGWDLGTRLLECHANNYIHNFCLNLNTKTSYCKTVLHSSFMSDPRVILYGNDCGSSPNASPPTISTVRSSKSVPNLYACKIVCTSVFNSKQCQSSHLLQPQQTQSISKLFKGSTSALCKVRRPFAPCVQGKASCLLALGKLCHHSWCSTTLDPLLLNTQGFTLEYC